MKLKLRVRVRQVDIDKAIRAWAHRGWCGTIQKCCPVYQALKRRSLMPLFVGTEIAANKVRRYDVTHWSLDRAGMKVTNLAPSQWKDLKPTTVTLTRVHP